MAERLGARVARHVLQDRGPPSERGAPVRVSSYVVIRCKQCLAARRLVFFGKAITSEAITTGLLAFLVVHYYYFNYLQMRQKRRWDENHVGRVSGGKGLAISRSSPRSRFEFAHRDGRG